MHAQLDSTVVVRFSPFTFIIRFSFFRAVIGVEHLLSLFACAEKRKGQRTRYQLEAAVVRNEITMNAQNTEHTYYIRSYTQTLTITR